MRIACLFLVACAGESLYPPRPAVQPGPPIADPPYSRAVAHISFSKDGLTQVLDATIPKTGEGTFQFLGERRWQWSRQGLDLRFDNSTQRIGVKTTVTAQADLPAKSVTSELDLLIEVQPVISSTYKAKFQSPVVTVTPRDRLLKTADWFSGAVKLLKETIEDKLREQAIDLRPMVEQAHARAGMPQKFQLGDAEACVDLGVKAIETSPTQLIDGFEKDIALVLGPSVTLPCLKTTNTPALSLPPLQNVASLPPGPFTVTVPVAATYEELQRAMTKAFTDGKLYFAKDFPNLYLEKPEVYANGGQVVVKLHIDGFVDKGVKMGLSGELYLAGHPTVHDNELEFDDMQPTIETSNALLKLKTKIDAEDIRRQVKQALRLDISSRLVTVKEQLRAALTYRFALAGSANGCLKADIGRIEVANIYAHDTYLRLYVQVTAQAGAYVPCPDEPAPISMLAH